MPEGIYIANLHIEPNGVVRWVQASGMELDSLIRIPPSKDIHNAKGVADALRVLAQHIQSTAEEANHMASSKFSR